MAESKVCKNDIIAVFKRLRGIQSNKVCFDCGAKNPTWASVTYGVFICMDCSAVHRSLGVHLSFVRSTQLDTNWTWLQLRAMQVGGNANALSFFQQHGCTSTDAQQKYNSRAAQLYREKLHHQASAAIRLHGTKLHIEVPHVEAPQSPEHKEVDFFKDVTNLHTPKSAIDMQNGSSLDNVGEDHNRNDITNSDLNSRLDSSLIIAPDGQKQSDIKKSVITGRKVTAAKKNMGARKGLGAQKVSANFNDIEKEAQRADELRQQAESSAKPTTPISEEEEERKQASIRLAYKDISIRQKETEEKLRKADPRKAEQLERLGMGFGSSTTRSPSNVAHSAASEMKLITQENTSSLKNQSIDLDDDFEIFSFTSGPPKYGDSPFLTRSSSDSFYSNLPSKGSWSSEKSEKKSSVEIMSSQQKDTRYSESGRSRKATSVSTPANTDEAQKKFGNAKAISSEQFFGPNRDLDFEKRANLSRFEGSNSISSADYFGGDGTPTRSASMSSFSGPNLYDIKEGVRDGVTKVAGRLSSIANGVMSSLQDRYGY